MYMIHDHNIHGTATLERPAHTSTPRHDHHHLRAHNHTIHTGIGYRYRTPSAHGIIAGRAAFSCAAHARAPIADNTEQARTITSHAMHTYIHMKSDFHTTSRTTEGRQRNRGAQ